MAKCELKRPGGLSGLSLPPTISTTFLLGRSESCFDLFSYFSIFLRMTLFLNSYRPNQPPYTIFSVKMCRNVQINLGINLRHSLVWPKTQHRKHTVYVNQTCADFAASVACYWAGAMLRLVTFREVILDVRTRRPTVWVIEPRARD